MTGVPQTRDAIAVTTEVVGPQRDMRLWLDLPANQDFSALIVAVLSSTTRADWR